ncbi:ribbon-helix-helix domain-containing protein [Aphanizomenon sp. CS-733/32]|uniref:ribbon-helix-helix domain-containing protein n=1 Tax=Aphanizomenon sp. CS-733/32 TaxID=3021715 RepID=UPI002FEE3207
MTMNISLQPEQEQLIQAKLQTGKYENAYQVIVAALQLLEERDKHYEQWLDETRKKVDVGIEQANRRQLTNGDVAFAKLREKLAKKGESSQ